MQENELKLLWKHVFGDADTYIDRFFSQVYTPENTLVHKEDGHIVSMLHMVPYELDINGECFKAVYLYALATEEKYRERSIMSGLIRQAHTIAEERGYLCSFLIPEGESLFGFYKRFGYTVPFYDDEIIIRKDRLNQEISFVKSDKSRNELWDVYASSYDRQDKKIMLGKEQFLFFLEDFLEAGGKPYCVMAADKRLGYAYGISENGKITICHTDIDYGVLTGELFNADITCHIRGLFRPSDVCKNLGIDLNGIWVKNVLC